MGIVDWLVAGRRITNAILDRAVHLEFHAITYRRAMHLCLWGWWSYRQWARFSRQSHKGNHQLDSIDVLLRISALGGAGVRGNQVLASALKTGVSRIPTPRFISFKPWIRWKER
jgi:hypothetical protein